MNEQKKRKRPLPRSKKEGLMDLAGKYSAEVDSNKVRDTQREDQENQRSIAADVQANPSIRQMMKRCAKEY